MRLLATHSVQRRDGIASLCLYHGDLSAIPHDEAVDVLVVSAFPDNYVPTSTSLIGALRRRGISVADLSRDKEADLRGAFSSWISRDIGAPFPEAGFRRIVCFESSSHVPPSETVGDVFRALMPFLFGDPPIQSIAMPVLSSGNQGFDPEVMLGAIFNAATHWLALGLPIRVIKIVVQDAVQAERLRQTFTRLSASLAAPQPGKPDDPSGDRRPYDLFVSYSHEDASEVDGLVGLLQSTKPGLRVFCDRLVLNVGESWQGELDHALESAATVVAVYSPAYLRSKMCIEEFNMARLRHRESPTPILKPIYLRSAPLPLYMRSLQYIDCREADQARFPTVLRYLGVA